MTFWGATRVVQTRTNDRGVEHGCEEEGQKGQEGDQEEGRQEEEVIDLRSVDFFTVTPEHSLRTYPMNKAKAAAPRRQAKGAAAKLF
jgi:hypothetical protein